MDTPQTVEPAEPQGSGVESLWGVLLAPEKTFRYLAARPAWLPAMLLLVVTALGLSLVVTPKLDMKQVMREAIEESGQDVTEAQLDRQVEMADKFKWIGTASQVVLQPAVYLIMAGIFLIVFRLLGSEIDFRQSLSVSVHGMMPFVIATLLTVPVVLTRATLSLKACRARAISIRISRRSRPSRRASRSWRCSPAPTCSRSGRSSCSASASASSASSPAARPSARSWRSGPWWSAERSPLLRSSSPSPGRRAEDRR